MTRSNDFYIHLPSNVADNVDEESLCSYRTRFAEALNLNSDYEVGISNITFTKSWYNVSDSMVRDSKLVLIYESDKDAAPYIRSKGTFYRQDQFLNDEMGRKQLEPSLNYSRFYEEAAPYKFLFNDVIENRSLNRLDITPLRPGHYATIENLIMELNERIALEINSRISDPEFTHLVAPRFEIEPISRRLRMLSGFFLSEGTAATCFVHISGPLGEMLGIPQRYDKANPVPIQCSIPSEGLFWYGVQYPYCFDITGGIRCLLIYSDIVKPVRVGNSYGRLLRIIEVPNEIQYGQQTVITYPMIQYVPLTSSYLRSIDIHIKDDMGITTKSCRKFQLAKLYRIK